MRISAGLAFLTLLVAPFASAQHNHAAAFRNPVALYPGLGIWTHPIATRNAEAQKFFNQGLVLMYSFNRPESLRSFQKAAELDPRAAMAQWGIAMATGPYVNQDGDPTYQLKRSCGAVDAGLKIPGIGETDRAWLQAAATRCPDFAEPQKYVAAMRALAARFPDDPDAQTLYAEALMIPIRWHWYDSEGRPGPGEEEAERVLEGVLRRYPTHPGANHLYIHAVESSRTPERAIPSAQRLMGIVPAAGHMVHMPGHIWIATGEFQFAVDVNERAVAADREYFARAGIDADYFGYYWHNLHFIVYARSMQGRIAETNRAIAALEEAAQQEPDMAQRTATVGFDARLRTQQWDAILALPRPKLNDPLVLAYWRFARSMALISRARRADAAAERASFEKERAQVDRKADVGNNTAGDVLDLAAVVLGARMDDNVETWRKAVAMQDALVYDEPPAWYHPLRESLGGALLRSGDAAGAELVFREGVRRSPRNAWMLFGLKEALKAQGKTEAAAWVEREFEAASKGLTVALKISDL